jgi:hypothetical protein
VELMVETGNPRAAALHLLDQRGPGKTICPSEVAKAITATLDAVNWRAAMPTVHMAVDAMVAEGLVRLSWHGKAMAVRSGHYRIGRSGISSGTDIARKFGKKSGGALPG